MMKLYKRNMTMPSFQIQKDENLEQQFYVEILDGPFEKTKFVFGKIEVLEEDEEGNAHIKFDYDTLSVPEHINLTEQKEEFETEVGQVLHQILMQTLTEEQRDENNRNNNPEESSI